ncbi:MAG: flagellar brake protein [Gammaproteobacteria bacterium]|nr:flagellar brake protein [Gammaproteobacteria bacterium]
MRTLRRWQYMLSNKIAKLTAYKKKSASTVAAPVINNTRLYTKILTTLKNERSPLSIKFDQHPDTFISMILDIDTNHQFFIIDEINSTAGHELACLGEPFIVTARDNGIVFFFQSKVIDYGTIDGISFYRLLFPQHIEHLQRRECPRMIVPPEINMTADFLIPRHGLIRAQIADISLTGLRLCFPRNVKSIFDNFIKIEHCRIVTPFMPAQEFSLDIKDCRYEMNNQRTVVGCQFSNLDNVGLKFLSSLANHLQPARGFTTRL